MRPILFFLFLIFRGIYAIILDIFSVFMNTGQKLFVRVLGFVQSQTESVFTVFPRKPCSATGGSA